jgi:hypothetical protein
MIYKSVSIEEVIGRVVRNTRIQDSSYISDMNEWIPEAMGFMQTQYALRRRFKDIVVSFHKGQLPCDLEFIDAVEYQGSRLHWNATDKHYATGESTRQSGDNLTTFQSSIEASLNTGSDNNEITYTQFSNTYEDACRRPSSTNAWYQWEMDWLTTSFADGVVRVHYRGIPVDKNGLPLIPDNHNYKEAIYWYVRSKMYGAGYEEKQYKENDMMQRYETYAARAIGEITYPSVDQKEYQVKTQVRFFPPAGYYDNFFNVTNSENTLNY